MKTDRKAIVLYDADCGFCRWSLAKILAWDQRRALRPVALQSEEGRALTADLSESERIGSWHLVTAAGRFSAGAAGPPLLRLLPGAPPLAGLLARFPGATERAYRWVSQHRRGLARPISKGAANRARQRIERREG